MFNQIYVDGSSAGSTATACRFAVGAHKYREPLKVRPLTEITLQFEVSDCSNGVFARSKPKVVVMIILIQVDSSGTTIFNLICQTDLQHDIQKDLSFALESPKTK